MAAGTMTITTAGDGFLVTNGLLHGYLGEAAADTTVGLR